MQSEHIHCKYHIIKDVIYNMVGSMKQHKIYNIQNIVTITKRHLQLAGMKKKKNLTKRYPYLYLYGKPINSANNILKKLPG
jgi:hypothetical protein